MTEDIRFSEDEIARAIGYARVKGSRTERPRGRKANAARRFSLPSLPRPRTGAPRIALA
jgi:hypothetical protein